MKLSQKVYLALIEDIIDECEEDEDLADAMFPLLKRLYFLIRKSEVVK